MTESMRKALEWLCARGGDGVFVRARNDEGALYNTLLAGGDFAPFWWKTWLKLRDAGAIEEYAAGKARRFRVVEGAK